MAAVVLDITMSVDGFVTASNPSPEEPLGDGGEKLYEWASDEHERDRVFLAPTVGAVIAGRRDCDASVEYWGADGPSGPLQLPVFVVSHGEPETSPEGGVYTFVSDGIERAVEWAKSAAGDKDVAVLGGSDIGQQCIRTGLIDEISLHLAGAVRWRHADVRAPRRRPYPARDRRGNRDSRGHPSAVQRRQPSDRDGRDV